MLIAEKYEVRKECRRMVRLIPSRTRTKPQRYELDLGYARKIMKDSSYRFRARVEMFSRVQFDRGLRPLQHQVAMHSLSTGHVELPGISCPCAVYHCTWGFGQVESRITGMLAVLIVAFGLSRVGYRETRGRSNRRTRLFPRKSQVRC